MILPVTGQGASTDIGRKGISHDGTGRGQAIRLPGRRVQERTGAVAGGSRQGVQAQDSCREAAGK